MTRYDASSTVLNSHSDDIFEERAPSQSFPNRPQGGLRSLWGAFVRPHRIKQSQRTYREQLHDLVEPVVESMIRARSVDRIGASFPSLVLGLCQDYPASLQPWILDRWKSLFSPITRVCMAIIGRGHTTCEGHLSRLKTLKQKLSDRLDSLEEVGQQLDHTNIEEISADTLTAQFNQERLYNRETQILAGLKAKIFIPLLLGAILMTGESYLIHGSFSPAFRGVSGVAMMILPLQTGLLTVVMLVLAHFVFAGKRLWHRLLAGTSLFLFSSSLTFIRVSSLAYKTGGNTLALHVESLAMNAIWGGAAFCFALIGAWLFRVVHRAWHSREAYLAEHTERIARKEAERTASKVLEDIGPRVTSQNHTSLLKRERTLRAEVRTLQNEIRDTEETLERVISVQIREAMNLMASEIKNAASQFARWSYLED